MPSMRNCGLKPISSGSPENGAGIASLRVADVGRLGGDRQLALREREPQRRVALRELADRRVDLEELRARQAHVVLEGLGQQLAIVRELALDQPRARGSRRRPRKMAWLRGSAISTSSTPSAATIRASSRSARAGTFASSVGADRRLELGVLDASR